MAGRVLKETVTARLNSFFQLEDCSIGAFGNDQPWLDDSLGWRADLIDGARTRFAGQVANVVQSVSARTAEAQVQEIATIAAAEITSALGNATWRRLFPGKELLDLLAKRLGFNERTILANVTIRELAEHPERIDPELTDIVKRIAGAPTDNVVAPVVSN
jgi:hypothetical protein